MHVNEQQAQGKLEVALQQNVSLRDRVLQLEMELERLALKFLHL